MNGSERKQWSRAADAALRWYAENARDLPWRKNPTPYHIWLSEIIFQQTRIEAGTAYYLRFLEEAPDVFSLAAMPEEKLLKLWEGLGYYSRARNLHKAAKKIASEAGGVLPDDPKELAKLPGIGPYTAGAIASIAYGRPVPAVDGNVLRVVSRLFAREDDVALPETKKRIGEELSAFYGAYFGEGGRTDGPENRGEAGKDDPARKETVKRSPGDLNQAWMDLGATVCLPNGEPRCSVCPFEAFCVSHGKGTETAFPVKTGPKPRTVRERTVFVLRCRYTVKGKESRGVYFYLRRRPDKGLLAGLWELPAEDGFLSPEEARKAIEAKYVPCAVDVTVTPLPDAKHIFSHVEWRMKGYLIDVVTPCTEYGADRTEHPHILCTDGSGDPAAAWKTPEEIERDCPVPSAFHAYRPYLSDQNEPAASPERPGKGKKPERTETDNETE